MLTAAGKSLATVDRTAPGSYGINVKTVVLSPGTTAYFGLIFADGTGYARKTCPTAAALKLTPPQATAALTLRGPRARIQPFGGTIQHLDCGIVGVSAVTPKRFQ